MLRKESLPNVDEIYINEVSLPYELKIPLSFMDETSPVYFLVELNFVKLKFIFIKYKYALT